MKTSGHQFATNTRSKKRSGVPKRSRAQPQKRVPLTSERWHANPAIGRAGFSRGGLPTSPVIPTKSRTIATSPNGTPVCAMPNGPGFIPTMRTSRGLFEPQRSRYASCGSRA